MIIDGKRLSEAGRLQFMADLEHTGEFCELLPLGQAIALLPPSQESITDTQVETAQVLAARDEAADVLEPAEIVAGQR